MIGSRDRIKPALGVRSPLLLVAIILSSSLSYSSEPALHHEPETTHPWAVYFSPSGGAAKVKRTYRSHFFIRSSSPSAQARATA